MVFDSLHISPRRMTAGRWELPLTVVAYADLFGGWTMDAVARSTAGSGRSRSCCTFCGVLRRRALEEGARLVGATHVVTVRKHPVDFDSRHKEPSPWGP
ncbi:Cytoplasmic tRNA 2-thiolation protein 1 [Pteropus alecto]|uniref:Cytoplasmic tRNA 2-thiolation protein 1 n=1 Tax=Pteropus alecto TaxID=9402 RepID=L5L4X9_PTEAL|nr:Cytoplasmic tRNA 2-thiolation protein 1 [Pteropus alecto]